MRHTMQIREITLTHELHHSDDPEHLKQILAKYGWKSLGTGLEAAVAMHPQKSYVLKIFPSHSAYVKFVQFVQSHAQNPHVPRFSRYVKQIPGTNLAYVRMEKLLKVTESQLLNNYTGYLAEMLALGEVTEMSMLADGLAMHVEDKLMGMGYDVADLMDPDQQEDIYVKLGGEPPQSWMQVLSALAEYSDHVDVEGGWDMHSNNFMRRGKTLVIVDPFF